MRLDQALVHWKMAPSRTKAQSLIDSGEVQIFKNGNWTIASASSLDVSALSANDVRVNSQTLLKYVSRGGLKLESALEHLKNQINVQGLRCVDVGQSTGGFTDCLLQHGARAVLGIDVGHDQLHPKIKTDERVTFLEGLHVKDITPHAEVQNWLRGGVDLVVFDLSFISCLQVIPELAKWIPKGTFLLGLIKPQFEVGPNHLDKRGLVRDENLFDEVKQRVLNCLQSCGFSSFEHFASQWKGQDGNQEFFSFSRRD